MAIHSPWLDGPRRPSPALPQRSSIDIGARVHITQGPHAGTYGRVVAVGQVRHIQGGMVAAVTVQARGERIEALRSQVEAATTVIGARAESVEHVA